MTGWKRPCTLESVRHSEVQVRPRRLLLLSDTLEGLSIGLLVYELTGVLVPLRPVPVDGILDLRAIPDGTMAVAIAFGRIGCHHLPPLL